MTMRNAYLVTNENKLNSKNFKIYIYIFKLNFFTSFSIHDDNSYISTQLMYCLIPTLVPIEVKKDFTV